MEAFKIDLYNLTGLNKDIDIKTNLLNKTWRVFNDSDVKETCVFSEDGKITIIKDGVETTVSWELDSTDNAIVIGENKLNPSYKDNVLFVFNIPEKGKVVLVDEKNELSIIPTTRQDIYDYFQKAELVYYRFSYKTKSSKAPILFVFIPILLCLLIFLLALTLPSTHLIERIFVEFGVDDFSWTYVIIPAIILAWPLFKLSDYYDRLEKRITERDRIKSQQHWIKDNTNYSSWKQYGYSLLIFCRWNRRLLALDTNYDIGSNCIGFHDINIKTRDQLLKVDKAIRELRESLCYKVKKYLYFTILIVIALLTFTLTIVLIKNYGEQLPYFSFDGNFWGLNIIPLLIYYFAPALVVTFGSDYMFYKMNQRKLRKWIANNPSDWRKEYVMFKNYFDYKEWRG